MAFDVDGNMVGVVAVAIPVVGSIALFSFLSVAAWSNARRREREEYYRNETLKKIAESSGEGAKAAIDLLHEQNRTVTKHRLEGMKLGGLITAVVGKLSALAERSRSRPQNARSKPNRIDRGLSVIRNSGNGS